MAVEFVATSVTSDNIDDIAGVPPRTVGPVIEGALTTLNRHIKWVEVDSHGACVLDVTPAAVQMDWFFLANKEDPASALSHARSYRVRAGTQKVQRVGLAGRGGRRLMAATFSRRTLLGGAAGAAALGALGAITASSARAADDLRVYVLVVDGCRPDEAVGEHLSTVRELAAQGTSYSQAKSITVAETIPNHVAMMTGVHPDRSGVPANSVWDPALGEVRDLGEATDLTAPTLLERLPAELGLPTASVLSKDYLFGVFGERASHRWTPEPMLPITNHAPDIFTMGAALDMIDEHDPALHVRQPRRRRPVRPRRPTGSSIRLLRTLALIDTERRSSAGSSTTCAIAGMWERSVVILLSDHSMDWSLPLSLINLAGRLDDDPLLDGNVQIAQNGGADLLYWTGPRGVPRRGDRPHATDRGGHRPACCPCTTRRSCGWARTRATWSCTRRRAGGSPTRRDLQPDPGQPRPPGHRADPVRDLRRPPDGAPRPGVLGAGPHDGRGADGRVVVRAGRAGGRLGRRGPHGGVPAVADPGLTRRGPGAGGARAASSALVSRPGGHSSRNRPGRGARRRGRSGPTSAGDVTAAALLGTRAEAAARAQREQVAVVVPLLTDA